MALASTHRNSSSLQRLQAEHPAPPWLQLSAQPWPELAPLAASWVLTHRRAEVELLQACEEMILVKAFEASENFFMSTGLGTLPAKRDVSGAGSQ